ncbi:methyl-CpG-binding domain-containing protein 10-like isoform X2 [Miscanthus floridulus]|uniref:methyl-CpG-binding domain-containing protein 10-like isoform X2 n=1 Tax=Miscanthus floridulus TaxID=154761 RepID=UPI00345A2D80
MQRPRKRIERSPDEKALKGRGNAREAAAAAMDLDSLSRRELQALCKSNGIRANMSNAAMAEALRCLPSVDRTDEIGRTAPPMSAMKEVTIMEEQTHGSLLPRGSRARAKTRMIAAGNTEEDVPDLTLQGCQRTAARKAAVAPEAAEAIGEEQELGCPLPRGGRARGKTRKAGARKMEEEVVPAPHALPGNKRTVADEAVDAEEVAIGMRTRRSARSKVKIALDQKEEDVQAAVRKEHKVHSSGAAIASAVVSDKSCGDSEEHAVVIMVEEEVAKPQEGQNMTRRAAPYKTHEDLQQDQRTAEEVATTKKRTRRSTRSKVAAAARKGQKADSSDTTIGPEVDPKADEVVPKVEEAAKPQEGKNETRRATVYKAREEVQPGQVTVAPEVMAAVEAEEVATAKRRRSVRSKVRVAARKGQKVNGPTVSDDPKEEQVGEVVEEGPTKPNEEKREQISNVCQFASLPKLEDSPGVVSKPNAADASDKAAVADEEAIKEDDFTFTGEADLSNLLVNTLDRFAKPMYVSTDKEEKKGSECWWMLL